MEIKYYDLPVPVNTVQLYQQQLKILQGTRGFFIDGQGVVHTARLPLYCDGRVEYVKVYLEHHEYLSYCKFLQESLKKAEVEILEEAFVKLLRKYKKTDPTETWSRRWVASPIAYLLPKERREEWLGDLYEVNREMLHKGYPRWLVNVINVGRTAILVVSSLHIKLLDLLSLGRERIK